jgi:hypothetical protein
MGRNEIVGIIIAVVIGLILYSTWKEPRTDWRSKYVQESYEPFDLAVSQQLLKDHFEIDYLKDSLQKSLLDAELEGSYIYFGNLAHDSINLELIRKFCEKGNDAHFFIDLNLNNFFYSEYYNTYRKTFENFIVSINNIKNSEYSFFQSFNSEEITLRIDRGNSSSEQNLKFNYPEGIFQFNYFYIDYEYAQLFESEGVIEDAEYENDFGDLNYFSTKVGDGKIYIHLCPLAFSNYSLTDPSNLNYFEAVTNNISSNKLIIDNFNSEVRGLNDFIRNQGQNERQASNNGPLSYIFANPALKFSWYLILSGIILFIFFQAKRKQRPIPVLSKKKNRSLEFIEQSAYIFFRSKDHDEISKIQIAMFNNFIKEEYGLNFNAFKQENIAETAKRTQLPEEQIKKVGEVILYIERLMHVEEKDLIKLNRALENFYQLSENK